MQVSAKTKSIMTPIALDTVFLHACQQYPIECCGIVFGPRDKPIADEVRECINIQDELHARDPVKYPRSARTAYQFHDEDVLAVWNSFCGCQPAKIIYHSHINSSACFSSGDQRAARAGNQPTHPVDHLVIEVRATGVICAVQYGWNRRRRRYVEVFCYRNNIGNSQFP